MTSAVFERLCAVCRDSFVWAVSSAAVQYADHTAMMMTYRLRLPCRRQAPRRRSIVGADEFAKPLVLFLPKSQQRTSAGGCILSGDGVSLRSSTSCSLLVSAPTSAL